MATLDTALHGYISALRQTPPDQQTEHTGRSALETLLSAARDAGGWTNIVIQHEPQRADDKGSPDFKISQPSGIIGYVEVKQFGANLDKVLKSEQIKKYRQLSPNLLVTDYLRFIWLHGDSRTEARLSEVSALEGKSKPLNPDAVAEVSALLAGFLSTAPQGIAAAKPLAEALAVRSHLLREFLAEELVRQDKAKKKGKLHGLFDEFKRQVSHEITLDEFADAYAQTLAYGLFLARLNADDPKIVITLDNVEDYVPASVGLIRELVGFLKELKSEGYRDIRWVVEEVLSIINGLKLAQIHEDLAFRNRRAKRGTDTRSEEEWRLFSRDPFIYFYEDYLKAYDKSTRESRGVYYTPPPIVNFIVRAIDDILKDSFDIPQGLADRDRVTVLDFACGTGTFLVEVLERIFETIGGEKSAKAEGYVREHMLKNIFGFEYLIAPYTIAHLKLGQYLKDKGHPLSGDERFQVYLTNTLEPIEPQLNALLPELSHETEAAQAVKDRDILVITGNPPYEKESRNNGPSAKRRVAKYRSIVTVNDGVERVEPLSEKNWKGLQDDYVKFLAFAQEKLDAVPEGIVAVVSNNSFLDNVTARGIRHSLMQSFDRIYILDLHGSSKKKEQVPDNGDDVNVFDIMQGVSISLFVKRPGISAGVWHADLWGSRQSKYEFAAHTNLDDVDWEELTPREPLYLFKPRDNENAQIFEREWSIKDIFDYKSVGFVTARDRLSIHYTEEQAVETATKFRDTSVEEARTLYRLGKDTRDWSIDRAQADLVKSGDISKNAERVAYRPFDDRFTIYTSQSRGFLSYPRSELRRNLQAAEAPALITSRLVKGEPFAHIFVSNVIAEKIALSAATSNNGYQFPLYRVTSTYRSLSEDTLPFPTGNDGPEPARVENIAPEFRRWIDERYDRVYTPEYLLGYIYAVLHAPTYRTRYADFLRTDFPRIPFPDVPAQFEALAALGEGLIAAHLLRDVPARGLGRSPIKGSNLVEQVRWSAGEQKIWINAAQAFTHVPERVWNFTIGGYQVIDKYLKSRKGRVLSLDEIEQIERIANVLDFTVDQMAAIDLAYVETFPGGDAEPTPGENDVVSDPDIMGGEPVFRGTRIPVRAVAEMMQGGADAADMLKGYPSLNPARLAFAARWASAHPAAPQPPEQTNSRYKVLSRRTYPRRKARA